jgi:hypothetical protein
MFGPGDMRNMNAISRLLVFALAGGTWSIPAHAGQHGAFTYTVDASGTEITITDYTGGGGNVEIPMEIEALPVTTIGKSAFYASSGLTSVTIPASVTTIEDYAFYNIAELTTVSIGTNVTDIGVHAFSYCDALTDVTIPASVTNLENYAFYSCGSLTNISVNTSNTVYSSSDGAFLNKNQTLLIKHPEGRGGSYSVPNSVTAIHDLSFALSYGLTNVAISTGVTSVGWLAFKYCTGLTSINVDTSNTVYSSSDGVLFNKDQTTLVQYPTGRSGSYVIPSSVTTIGDNAFYYCIGLTGVTIPTGVTTIGISAFDDCDGLTNVTIPASVTTMESGAFKYCSGLTNVTISIGVTTIGESAFRSCSYLTDVTIPISVTTIESLAFYSCGRLTNVTISASVTTIGNWAFRQCYNLPKVTIPATVTTIGNMAFEDCRELANVYFTGDAPIAGVDVFADTDATVYYLPDSIGWGSTYAGRPAVLWNPKIAAIASSGGVPSFTIAGTPNIPIAVETCTNLIQPQWLRLQATNLTAGSLDFTMPDATNRPVGFYRIVAP